MAGLRTLFPCIFKTGGPHCACISGKRRLQKSLLQQTSKLQLITACLSNTAFDSFLQSSSSHELTSRHIRKYSSNRNSATYYYEVLGIGKDATQKEIKSAYYKMSKLHHPDVSKDPSSQKKFQEISQAYETLGDLNKRRLYDKGVYGSRQYSQDRSGAQEDKGQPGSYENIYTQRQREQYMRYRQMRYEHMKDHFTKDRDPGNKNNEEFEKMYRRTQMKYEQMRDQFTKDRDPGRRNSKHTEFERIYRQNMEELQRQKYKQYMDDINQRDFEEMINRNRPYTEQEKKQIIFIQTMMKRYLIAFFCFLWLSMLFGGHM